MSIRTGLAIPMLFFLTLSGGTQDIKDLVEQHKEAVSRVKIEYVGYRSAEWEAEKVIEPENERPNQGGLVSVYLTNTTDRPLGLRNWHLNRQEDHDFRLGGKLAWDRLYDETLQPGQSTVLEINGVSEEFASGKPFQFALTDRDWTPCGFVETVLRPDDLQVSFLRVLPGMREVEVHLRNRGTETYTVRDASVPGHAAASQKWSGTLLPGRSRVIGRIQLAEALSPSTLLLVRITAEKGGEAKSILAHRRAHEDYFPIGTWSNEPERFEWLARLHIDTFVRGGRRTDAFYRTDAARFGFRGMVHTGVYPDVDLIRDLGDQPAVACWMLQDEPDWVQPPLIMLMSNETVKRYNQSKPTFMTLCRNVKFFEYASIVDIPCMDHYAVTAPSSSQWPHRFGTRLEETAYYTEDLKKASEPKPIWIWSQALADWDERPKMPVPTPDELASQLVLNLGRGAKGILWFNMEIEAAENHPDTREAVRGWGRVLKLLRDDLLGSEPMENEITASEGVDARALVGWDRVVVCLTNTEYEMRDDGYRWNDKPDVSVSFPLPVWITPEEAFEVSPGGLEELRTEIKDGTVRLALPVLHACTIIVLAGEKGVMQSMRQRYQEIVSGEEKTMD